MTVHVTTPSEANAIETAPGAHMIQLFGNGDKNHPMHCGTGGAESGRALTFDTRGYGFMIILEGEGQVEDDSMPGEIKVVKPGDVLYWEKGSRITWTSVTKSRVFYTVQIPLGEHDVGVVGPEEHH